MVREAKPRAALELGPVAEREVHAALDGLLEQQPHIESGLGAAI
jgi:hypothetical protein